MYLQISNDGTNSGNVLNGTIGIDDKLPAIVGSHLVHLQSLTRLAFFISGRQHRLDFSACRVLQRARVVALVENHPRTVR